MTGDAIREAINFEIYDEGVHRDGPDSKPIMWWDCTDAAMRVITRSRTDPELRSSLFEVMGLEVLPMQCPECDHKPVKKPRFTCANCGAVKVHDEFEILLARAPGEPA